MTTATTIAPKTTTLDERIATRRAELTKQRAAIPEDGTLPLSTTRDEAAALATRRQLLDRRIAAFNTTVGTWAALPTLDADSKWRDHLIEWRKTIDAELLAMPPRIRNATELELQQRLVWSIRLIDFGLGISTIGPIISLSSTRVGELMAAAGYATEGPGLRGPNGFRGSLPEVEKRIKDLTKQRTEAQTALDVLLRTDEEKATQADEDRVFYETMKTMHCRNGSDGHLRAFTLDDDELPVSDMTAAQRQAFARFEAAHFGRPRETVTS